MLIRLLLLLSLLIPSLANAAYQSLGKLEDSPSANADLLLPAGCVIQGTISTTVSTDLDYGNVKCTTAGALYVSVADQLPAGANNIGTVTIVASGSAASPTKREDDPHISGDQGIAAWGVIHSTSTTGLGSDGDYAALGINTNGELYTTANTEMPAAAALADATSNPTVPGVASFLMCWNGTTWDRCRPGVTDTDDNSVAFSQTTAMMINLNYVSSGTAWVRSQPDPCSYLTKTAIPVNISTATTTKLNGLAGASTNYYVCSINLVTAAANNVALVDDDADGCGSVNNGLAGGTTAASGWNFGANGGLTMGNGLGTVAKTNGTNRELCIVTSANTQLSGSITVAAAP